MANKYPSVITDYSNIGGMGLVSNPTANDILITNSGEQAQEIGKQFSTGGTLSANSNNKIPTEQAVKTYVDTTATSAFNLRGGWDASSNLFPTTGGTGTGGAVEAGNLWIITVAGTLGGNSVEPNDIIVALVDTPGQTDSNWNISSNVVLSVNGQTGTVVLTYSDVGAQPLNANLTTLSNANLSVNGSFTTPRVLFIPDADSTAVQATAPVANQFVRTIGATGIITMEQPSYSNLSGNGSTNITTLGTITAGTWNGTTIDSTFGGTGQSTYATGDILFASATNTLSKLSGNTTAIKNFLSQTGTGATSSAPTWETLNADDLGNGTTGSGQVVLATSPAMSGIILSDDTITMNFPSLPSSIRVVGGVFLSMLGNGSCDLTVSGPTDITLPTSGTLATLAGSEALTNKTYNGLTVTTSTGTLTIANSKTLNASNTLTFTGTDSSSIAFGSGGTVAYTGGTLAQFAATTSAQLAGVISDETGSGALVFANTPTLVTPILGTPSSGDLVNCVNLPIISGVSGLGAGVATFLATPSSANLASAVTDETGTGSLVFGTTPTFTTNITSPLVIGGTGTTSTLTLKSTSGVGTTGADIIFQAGNNGATEVMRLLNSGNVGVGTTSSTGFRMTVSGGAQDTLKIASTQGVSLNIQNTSTDTIQRIYGTSGTNFWDFRATSTTLAYRVNDQTYMSVGTGANSDVNFTGNINFSTAGKSISYKEGGSDAMSGLVTLSNGSVTVNTTSVTANSRFDLTYQTLSGTQSPLGISARSAGVSFTISGGGVGNNSTVFWVMHNDT
jgi:hypothetical protein